jgi:hypothetical protein
MDELELLAKEAEVRSKIIGELGDYMNHKMTPQSHLEGVAAAAAIVSRNVISDELRAKIEESK